MIEDTQSPLVSAEWLAEHLHAPELAIMDATYFLPHQARDAHKEYRDAHIPGAHFFDIDVIADPSSPYPHMLPAGYQFADAARNLGIDNETRVIVYDNNDFLASARVWWTFRVFGHDKVSVLDAGLHGGKAIGGPLESGSAIPAPREFKAVFRPELVFGLSDVLKAIDERDIQIVDARSPGRFSGAEPEPRPGVRRGHIPNSRNVFFQTLIDEPTRKLKTAPELAQLFQRAGIDVGRPVVTTCGSGVTASILALALYYLGQENVAVYDGSWTEWGSRADTPVETGG
jgi:thiosulfate/3-mercaptopyruvate sulfurtransferase